MSEPNPNTLKRPRGRPRLPDNEISADALRMRKVYLKRRNEECRTSTPTVAALRRGYHSDAAPNRSYGVFAFTPSRGTKNGRPLYYV